MATALDYSAGRPTAAAVKAAQHVGVVRYAGTPGRKKNITRAEYLDMDRQGVGVALVFEDAAGDALKGRARGVTAARAIVADAAAIGFPTSRPLYFAVDQDIASQMGTVLEYFRGIGSVLGGRPAGVYGEADVLDAVMGAGLARFGWQTVAWSRGRAAKTRHLFQRAGQTFVGGIQVDVNDILAADWGQHNATEDDVISEDDFNKFMWTYRFDDDGKGHTGNFAQAIKGMRDTLSQLVGLVGKGSGATAADVAAALLPSLTTAVVAEVARVDAISDEDAQQIAKAVTDRAAALLQPAA